MTSYKTIEHLVPGDRLLYGYLVVATKTSTLSVEITASLAGKGPTLFCAPLGTLMVVTNPPPSVADRVNPEHSAYDPAFAELRREAYRAPQETLSQDAPAKRRGKVRQR